MQKSNASGRSRPGWIDVDLNGLAKILARRSKEFIVYELIQNAWDERTSKVEVRLPRPERGRTRIVVTDDSPGGFQDLTHAFTLYAESDKKRNARQRGMFNAGEKFVLAFCEEASIITTTGSIIFDAHGRQRSHRCTQTGSEFSGLLNLSLEEWEQSEDVLSVIPGMVIRCQAHDSLVVSHKRIGPAPLPIWRADLKGTNESVRARDDQVLPAICGERAGDAGCAGVELTEPILHFSLFHDRNDVRLGIRQLARIVNKALYDMHTCLHSLLLVQNTQQR
jgi:hypothetical protein